MCYSVLLGSYWLGDNLVRIISKICIYTPTLFITNGFSIKPAVFNIDPTSHDSQLPQFTAARDLHHIYSFLSCFMHNKK